MIPIVSNWTTKMTALGLTAVCSLCLGRSAAAGPLESEAWRRSLELAAAFSNDGFRIRDGHWIARFESGSGSKVLETNLYAGNAYWFCAATRNPESAVTLSIHDASGAVLISESTLDEGRSAMAFTPEISGPYYLRITLTPKPGQAPSADSFCVVYTYK